MADHEIRTGMLAPESGRYTPANGGRAIFLSKGERFPPVNGEAVTFSSFAPDRYIEWLTTLQASRDLGISYGELTRAIADGKAWTDELRFLNTGYGRLFDPDTINAASEARKRSQ